MYSPLKRSVLALFKAPSEPPEPPAGAHDSVRVLRASPKYLRYRLLPLFFVAALIGVGFVGACAGALLSGEPGAFVAALLVPLFGVPAVLLAYFCARVDYELRYYVVTDRSVRVRQGAWLVDEKTITFANVQNVRVEQGPLQRLFGISDVRIDTAGGGASAAGGKHGGGDAHGVAIAGLEDAGEVRDTILEHLRHRAKDSGLGDLDDQHRPGSPAAAAAGLPLDALREVLHAARRLRETAQSRTV